MTESAARTFRRMLVALDAMRSRAGDWDAAMELAAVIGIELQGLFVEDADLLGLASLPMAHEVGRLSGQPRPLGRESLESVLHRRVERTVSALVRAGRMHNVAVTHAIARGKLVRQALERGEHGDVVFLVGPGLHGRVRTRQRVMLWYDAGPSAQLSIALALHLVERTGAELTIGFPVARFPRVDELRMELGGLLSRAPHGVSLIAFADARIETILEAATSARIARIVLGADSPLINVDALEQLSAAFSGDLIILR